MYQHFKKLNDISGIPIIIYNIPGRCVVDMSVETMARLSRLDKIIGVKDATADISRTSLQRHVIGEDFIQLSGEDMTALALMAHGGRVYLGNIKCCTTGTLVQTCRMLSLSFDFKKALAIQDKLIPLHKALFLETSPAPVKYALSLLDYCEDVVRLPLVSVTSETQVAVRDAMIHAGIL